LALEYCCTEIGWVQVSFGAATAAAADASGIGTSIGRPPLGGNRIRFF
jgi:hypothetical protein